MKDVERERKKDIQMDRIKRRELRQTETDERETKKIGQPETQGRAIRNERKRN